MSAAAVPGSEDPEPYSRGAPTARLWSPAFVDLLIAEALFGLSYSMFVLLPKLLAVGYGATAGQIGGGMAAVGGASPGTIPRIAPVVKRAGKPPPVIAPPPLLSGSAPGFLPVGSAGGPGAP